MKDLQRLSEIEDRLAEIAYAARPAGPLLKGRPDGARFVADEAAELYQEARSWQQRWQAVADDAETLLARLGRPPGADPAG